MKRLLTLSMCGLGMLIATAQTTPAIYPGGPIKEFSPSGKWAISDAGDNNPLVIIDFANGKDYSYNQTYTYGSGNAISDNGVAVGSKAESEKAAVWQNGEWSLLNIPKNTVLSYANGVTPDGSRIVGNISPSEYAGDSEGTMVVPCYWDRKSDGTYEGPIMLPRPHEDFTGRAPQYVTCVRVSDDGKTIAGQMLDYLGMVCQPLMYFQDENGEWEYQTLLDDLFHPAGYELPENPGEAPTQFDFMTEEEIAAYEKAVEEYEALNDQNADYPDIYDYMTETEYWDFYYAASDWNERFEEFNTALWDLVGVVPNFDLNNIFMTSDGSLVASTDAKYYIDEVQDIYFHVFIPYVIDVATGEYKAYPAPEGEKDVMVSYLADDGTVLGQWNDADYGIFNGYILTPGAKQFIPIYDFVKSVDPATAKWMEENMTHTYERYDLETGGSVMTTVLATGVPTSVPDLTLVGFGQYSFWDFNSSTEYYGYIISLPAGAGVEEIVKDNLGDGTYRVFNLQGVKVLETKDATKLSTMSKGIYIINGKKVAL